MVSNSARRPKPRDGFEIHSHRIGRHNGCGWYSAIARNCLLFWPRHSQCYGDFERIAEGNLSQKISTTRRDELGRLLVSLRHMQEAAEKPGGSQRSATELKDRDHATRSPDATELTGRLQNFRSSIGGMLEQAEEMTERMNLTARTLSTFPPMQTAEPKTPPARPRRHQKMSPTWPPARTNLAILFMK